MIMHQISDVFQFATWPYRWYHSRVLLIDYDNVYTIMGSLSDRKNTPRKLRKNSSGEYEAYNIAVGDGKELYGVCDTVLFSPNTEGYNISLLSNDEPSKYTVFPMEYKQKEHKGHLQEASHLQCVAQARCLEKVFNCQIDAYYIYYKTEHLRRKYAIKQSDRDALQLIINKMNDYLISHSIPKRAFVEGSCPKCSMYEYCLPDEHRSPALKKYIEKEGN